MEWSKLSLHRFRTLYAPLHFCLTEFRLLFCNIKADIFLGSPSRARSVGSEPATAGTLGSRRTVQRPESMFTTNNRNLEEHFNIRQSYSAWPVRNGSPSPWLERYKIKHRASTLYARQKPQNSNKEITRCTKQNQQYINFSSAAILGPF